MILIDGLHINMGGGKVLLYYLIEELEKTNKEIFYLLDERIQNNLPIIKSSNQVKFLYANFINRYKFYSQNKDRFTTVFCFGNLPPYKRMKAFTITYFHQQMYIQVPKDFKLAQRLLFYLKTFVLSKTIRNTNLWIVQNNVLKKDFSKKYKIDLDKISILPFYPPLSLKSKEDNFVNREKYSYIYVSNATPNKNHQRLITAFCEFFDKYKIGTLTLTVSENYLEVKGVIEAKQKAGYPIKNIGFVERNKLSEYYQNTEYLIFPSLAESFGLGIVEAIDNGCKIIGADLPYMHAVCEPSILFKPLDIFSIVKAFEDSITNKKESISYVKNNIIDIINLLE